MNKNGLRNQREKKQILEDFLKRAEEQGQTVDKETLVGGKKFFSGSKRPFVAKRPFKEPESKSKTKEEENKGEKKMFKFTQKPIQFDVNINKLLDAATEEMQGSPTIDKAVERREYAKRGKEKIAKLLKTLFPNAYEQEKAVRITRSKVFKGEVANGTYFFIDPENAKWVGEEVRTQLKIKKMGKKLILAIPERLDREGKAELRQKIIDVLTARKEITALISFADEQRLSFKTSRIAELLLSL